MAIGESAQPIYALLRELEGSEGLVLEELIRYMSRDDIKDFVERFRLNHDIAENIVQTHYSVDVDETTEDFETNDYEMCAHCQCTYHEDDDQRHRHVCESKDADQVRFFSSRIPEC